VSVTTPIQQLFTFTTDLYSVDLIEGYNSLALQYSDLQAVGFYFLQTNGDQQFFTFKAIVFS
jgi:hypothetical protein